MYALQCHECIHSIAWVVPVRIEPLILSVVLLYSSHCTAQDTDLNFSDPVSVIAVL